MKKRSIIALVLAAVILTSCNQNPVNSESSSVKIPVESATATTYKSNKHYDIEPTCGACNFPYDVRNYYLTDYSALKAKDLTVTGAELMAYAKEKLDSIDSSGEMSVRGIYQNCGFEIVRLDKFFEWKNANGIENVDEHNSAISYNNEWEENATEPVNFGILLDPSGRFVIVHNCYDYKILYEFFNGRYKPEEHETLPQAELSEKAKEIYEYFNIQPPFSCTAFLTFDITGDGKEEYCYTISGGDGFYRSFVIICDLETENSYLYFSLDFDYSLEVVDDQLVLTVAKGQNCMVDMYPDEGKTEILVMKDGKLIFQTGSINGNCLTVGNYKGWYLFRTVETEDDE